MLYTMNFSEFVRICSNSKIGAQEKIHESWYIVFIVDFEDEKTEISVKNEFSTARFCLK